jgi:hypothetical protein
VEQLKEPAWTVMTADQLDGKPTEHLEAADLLIVRSGRTGGCCAFAASEKLRVIGRAGVYSGQH